MECRKSAKVRPAPPRRRPVAACSAPTSRAMRFAPALKRCVTYALQLNILLFALFACVVVYVLYSLFGGTDDGTR
jgi:hypothetical protein